MISAPKIVAVIGCISNPIAAKDALTFGIPIVIKYCPPTWHKTASAIKLSHPLISVGMYTEDSANAAGKENNPQKKVVYRMTLVGLS